MSAATTASAEPVSIRLLDRDFLVACADDERAGLIAAAGLLDNRMRELKGSMANPGFDRLAVLVALSVTHEYLALQKQCELQDQAAGGQIDQLRRKLEAALGAS